MVGCVDDGIESVIIGYNRASGIWQISTGAAGLDIMHALIRSSQSSCLILVFILSYHIIKEMH